MLTKDAFAVVIKGLRTSRGRTQEQLSAVSPRYLQQLETAKQSPTLDAVQRMADIFEIDAALLVLLCSATGKGESVQNTLSRMKKQINLLERVGAFEQIASLVATSAEKVGRPPNAEAKVRQKAVLSLRAMGLSHAEIAKTLQISKSTVQRALKGV